MSDLKYLHSFSVVLVEVHSLVVIFKHATMISGIPYSRALGMILGYSTKHNRVSDLVTSYLQSNRFCHGAISRPFYYLLLSPSNYQILFSIDNTPNHLQFFLDIHSQYFIITLNLRLNHFYCSSP